MRIAIEGEVRADAEARLLERVLAGPGFDLAAAGLRSHDVYLDGQRAVFVFDGVAPLQALRALGAAHRREFQDMLAALPYVRVRVVGDAWRPPPLAHRFHWSAPPPVARV
jgi:hypothetical protein